jgi:hypothetical protein
MVSLLLRSKDINNFWEVVAGNGGERVCSKDI